LAAVAVRSFLVGALLRAVSPSRRSSLSDFLDGLSQDELECLADFQGAFLIECQISPVNSYRLMADFFDPAVAERWHNPADRAHKTFVVLAWLDKLGHQAPLRICS
jgi:hypothetical protein